MAREEFLWFPDSASENEEAPEVTVTKFGGGYEARQGQSLNTTKQRWSLTFSKQRSMGLEIRDFLRRHGATKSFLWTNPFGEQSKFVCRKWNSRSDRGLVVVTAGFEEVFEE